MNLFNPFKPHLVRFSDGTFGVRRWRLWWQFLDMEDYRYWWTFYGERYWKTADRQFAIDGIGFVPPKAPKKDFGSRDEVKA